MMERGAPAGAYTVWPETTSNPGNPDLLMVGNSGATSARFALLTASARNLPPDRIALLLNGTLKKSVKPKHGCF